MKNKTYLIYKYTSPSGKSYIGQTCDLKRRENSHKCSTGCSSFARAKEKYGFENFIREILEEGLTLEEANERESYWIAEHNTLVPNGYNLMTGGNNSTPCEESRKLMSEAGLGREKTEEHKKKIAKAREEWFKTEEGIAWKEVLAKRFEEKQLYEVHPLLGVPMKQSSKDKMSKTKRENPTQRSESGKQSFKEKQEQNWANGVFNKRLKKYNITSPSGEECVIINLKQFCLDNDLNYNSVINTIDKKCYKGWSIKSYIQPNV
ncbi:MAG: GIY-YIG nuclease family protein [Bacilli bacterium]|nr:GIY-YIG nuclease family protein [Bacilli bacterium]